MKQTVRCIPMVLVCALLCCCGIGKYDKRMYYSPQPTEGWKSVGGRFYQFTCGQERVRVSPIVLSVREYADAYLWIPVPTGDGKEIKMQGRDKPWSIVEFYRAPREGLCEPGFFSLVNLTTGERTAPSSAETRKHVDSSSKREFVSCLYLYDIKQDPGVEYKLYLSDEALGCKATPIPYTFEEATKYWPALSP